LYGDKTDPLTLRILIAAKYNGLEIEVPSFNVGVDNKTNDYLNKSPLGKVPLLETNEGHIFEANAIARYVARQGANSLYGSSPFEAGLVEQWIDFAANDIELPGNVWVFPILGFIPDNTIATQKAKGDVRKAVEVLNRHLLSRTFLVGNRITLADIVVATSLVRLYEKVLDPSFRKQFTNVNRWFTTVVNQPNFRAFLPEVKLAEKMQVAPKVVEAKKEEPKKEQPKKEQPKKEQPKKEQPKKDEEEDFDFEEKEERRNQILWIPYLLAN